MRTWIGALLLVFGISAWAAADESAGPVGSLRALGAEFRRLRSVRGGDADRWGGRKHVVMQELGRHLGAAGTPRPRVIATMGAPDEVTGPGDALFDLARVGAAASSEAREVLVYEWRGRHDFLYFETNGRVVLRSGWWMAGE